MRNDPLNHTDPTGTEIFEDGELKLTLSLGASATGVLGVNVPEGANLEGDVVVQISVNLPALLQSIVGDLGRPSLPAISIERVGVQGTDFSEAPNVRGAMVDVDAGEVGVSLGTIADREGRSTTYQADVGPVGGEVFRPSDGGAAGSGFRVSGYGPGLGVAQSEGNTVTATSTPDPRRTPDEERR